MGIALPFSLGVAISGTLYARLIDDKSTSFTAFYVFIGTAMAITVLDPHEQSLAQSSQNNLNSYFSIF